ncbi:MAG: MoaD/ThiS family protein [Candidatus Bathyarchaeia archaeon]
MLPKVKVRLFHELRETIGQSELEIEANTLSDVVESLINRQGSLKELFFDTKGSIRGYTLFYVNNKVQNPPNLATKLNDGDLVLLIPPAAGG